jgi:hypothetical protein
MPMNQTDAENRLRPMIKTVGDLFYGGGDFKIFGTYVMAPRLQVTLGMVPNGNLTPIPGNRMGISVTSGLLALPDNAVMFALGHELGHGFSEAALVTIGLQAAGGCVSEVIADLGAAYLLSLSGSRWAEITDIAARGVSLGIFDPGWSGDHPPGQMRANCVKTLAELMQSGADFALASKAICLSMQGAKAS